MFKLNESKNKLEGILKLSDCEQDHLVKWIKNSQCSFYIGDDSNSQKFIKQFIKDEVYCYIDLNTFLKYLKTVERIFSKYSSMYKKNSLNRIDEIFNRFSTMKQKDAKIILRYESDNRYLKILNVKNNDNFEKIF